MGWMGRRSTRQEKGLARIRVTTKLGQLVHRTSTRRRCVCIYVGTVVMRCWINLLTLLQVHVVHFGVLDLLQLLAKLLCDLFALVVRLDFLFGAWDPEAYTAANHNHCAIWVQLDWVPYNVPIYSLINKKTPRTAAIMCHTRKLPMTTLSSHISFKNSVLSSIFRLIYELYQVLEPCVELLPKHVRPSCQFSSDCCPRNWSELAWPTE